MKVIDGKIYYYSKKKKKNTKTYEYKTYPNLIMNNSTIVSCKLLIKHIL